MQPCAGKHALFGSSIYIADKHITFRIGQTASRYHVTPYLRHLHPSRDYRAEGGSGTTPPGTRYAPGLVVGRSSVAALSSASAAGLGQTGVGHGL